MNSGKPTVLISIGIQDGAKTNGDSQESCPTRDNYRRYNQAWQLQQFYVDEPRWIEIDPDYVDASSGRGADPYILSRGKKFLRMFDDPKETSRMIANYNELADSSTDKRPSTQSRVRRSTEADEVGERFNDDDDDDDDESHVARNEEVLAEIRGGPRIHWSGTTDGGLGEQIKTNETNVSGRNETRGKLDLATYEDTFILSRGKKKPSGNGTEASYEGNGANRDGSTETLWQLRTHSYEDDDDDDDSAIKDHRMKRNACRDPGCVSLQLDWLRNIEKEIHQSLPLERRDKHRDILESLRLSEPYVISRGKKTPRTANRPYLARWKSPRFANSGDGDPVVVGSPPSLSAARDLPRMLLTARPAPCNGDNCDTTVNVPELTPRQWELAPRDRRGTLDEILAGYDPYYVARGKRVDPGNVLEMMRLSATRPPRNQTGVWLDENAARNGRLQ